MQIKNKSSFGGPGGSAQNKKKLRVLKEYVMIPSVSASTTAGEVAARGGWKKGRGDKWVGMHRSSPDECYK